MDKERVDKWLWHARFFKTRALAQTVIEKGHVRINGVKHKKPSATIAVGDVLTFTQARTVRVVEVLEFAQKRGPAKEAQLLYVDLTPKDEPRELIDPRG
ncbi:MAG: RNA-binding S4 domain-containing protein [Paracoccaceae bacterium]